jgi:hypothetical protein
MNITFILFLWFLAPFVAAFFFFSFVKSFVDWHGASFEPFGLGWILIKSFCYGTVGLLIGLTLVLCFKRSKLIWLPPLLAVVAAIAALS